MDSYGGIYGGMFLGQFYACPGTAQVAADGDHVGNARLEGPIDDVLAIIVISAVVEMGMGVDECRLYRVHGYSSKDEGALMRPLVLK
jgi:hypothetical protein